jgi:perosamine synthetase
MHSEEFIPVSAPDLSGNESKYAAEAVESTWVSSSGEFITRFESQLAEKTAVKHAITTSNGTTSLHLALATLGIGPGDEVIVPSLTFVATANVVRYCGATPIFTDVSADSWCIDAANVEKALTPQTKAVIAVHLFGNVADIDSIRSVLADRDIAIIEDTAEAQGASLNGHPAGSLGDIGCFSFYGNKIITTGEGGMLTTNSDKLIQQARKLRNHGMDSTRHYWHDEVGFNYRLTNVQAAIGVAQMERFDEITSKRQQVFDWYRERLSSHEQLTLQPVPAETVQAPWFFTLLLNDGIEREPLRAQMLERGIDTRPFFTPMHQLPIYKTDQNLPISEDVAHRGMYLPTFAQLTEVQVDRICQTLAQLT